MRTEDLWSNENMCYVRSVCIDVKRNVYQRKKMSTEIYEAKTLGAKMHEHKNLVSNANKVLDGYMRSH